MTSVCDSLRVWTVLQWSFNLLTYNLLRTNLDGQSVQQWKNNCKVNNQCFNVTHWHTVPIWGDWPSASFSTWTVHFMQCFFNCRCVSNLCSHNIHLKVESQVMSKNENFISNISIVSINSFSNWRVLISLQPTYRRLHRVCITSGLLSFLI